jgi:hypothetical protein
LKRGLTAIIGRWSVASLAIIALTGCEQRPTEVRILLKHKPGATQKYQQVAKGSARSYMNDSLVGNTYVEATTDITYHTRSVDPQDSTAEIAVTLTSRDTKKKLDDTSEADSTVAEHTRTVEYVQYIKPNGKLVDMDFESEHPSSHPDYLKQYYKQAFPVFPDQKVSVGYSWTQSTRVDLPEGPVDASTTYTVKSFVRERGYNCVAISYQGQCVLPLEPMPPDKKTGKQMIRGVDRINTDGMAYIAYEEGFIVTEWEQWRLEGTQVNVDSTGDTLYDRVAVDYDVDISLLSRDTANGSGTPGN